MDKLGEMYRSVGLVKSRWVEPTLSSRDLSYFSYVSCDGGEIKPWVGLPRKEIHEATVVEVYEKVNCPTPVVSCMDIDGHFRTAFARDRAKVIHLLKTFDGGDYWSNEVSECSPEQAMGGDEEEWRRFLKGISQRGMVQVIKMD